MTEEKAFYVAQDYEEYMNNVRAHQNWKTCIMCGERFQQGSNSKHVHCSNCTGGGRNRFIIFKRDEFKCAYCGYTSYLDGAELHIDHVHPAAEGGEGRAYNMITACAECNLAKSKGLLGNQLESKILDEIASRNEKHGVEPMLYIKIGREERTR